MIIASSNILVINFDKEPPITFVTDLFLNKLLYNYYKVLLNHGY